MSLTSLTINYSDKAQPETAQMWKHVYDPTEAAAEAIKFIQDHSGTELTLSALMIIISMAVNPGETGRAECISCGTEVYTVTIKRCNH